MLFAYARDTDAVVTVSGNNSTPSIATDAAWFSGAPSKRTIIAGMFSASPSSGDYVDIDVQWSNPRAVGLISALDLGMPAGVKVDVLGRRSGDAGFTYDLGGVTQGLRTAALPDGRVQLLAFPASADALIGYRVRIWNDRNGVTWGDDATDAGVGELGGWSTIRLRAVLIPHSRDRTTNKIIQWGLDGGAAIYARNERRTWSAEVSTLADEMQCGGLAGGLDIEMLEAMQTPASARCIAIPRDFDDAGAFSATWAHRTAVFGLCSFTGMRALMRHRSSARIVVNELL